MPDIDVRDEQVKYCTKINEYEYSRTTPGSSPTRTRLSTYTLPLPVSIPADQYAALLQSHDLAEIGTAIDIVKGQGGGSSMIDKVITGGVAVGVGAGVAALVGSLLRRGGEGVADKVLGGIGVGMGAVAAASPYAGAYGGVTRNPHTAMLFERAEMRSFNMVWRFSPRTEQQSRNISSLISALRLAMLPSYASVAGSTTRYALQYPRIFQVEFLGLDHVGYPKIDYSFLQNFAISTADRNGNVFYRNGHPTFVEIVMQFAEIDMKTREFYTGYGAISNADTTITNTIATNNVSGGGAAP